MARRGGAVQAQWQIAPRCARPPTRRWHFTDPVGSHRYYTAKSAKQRHGERGCCAHLICHGCAMRAQWQIGPRCARSPTCGRSFADLVGSHRYHAPKSAKPRHGERGSCANLRCRGGAMRAQWRIASLVTNFRLFVHCGSVPVGIRRHDMPKSDERRGKSGRGRHFVSNAAQGGQTIARIVRRESS